MDLPKTFRNSLAEKNLTFELLIHYLRYTSLVKLFWLYNKHELNKNLMNIQELLEQHNFIYESVIQMKI